MEKKTKPLRKIVLLSLISSVVVNAIGFLINLISYLATKELLLCFELSGGEYTGQIGFGLLQNHYWPFYTNNPDGKEQIYLEFEPISLIVTLILFFFIAFIIINQIKMKKEKITKPYA